MAHSKWEDEAWLEDGRSILSWLERVDLARPITLLLRHSHRLHSDDQNELLHMQLTPLGVQMATEFGSRIPIERDLEVFYSEHPRCEETALRIIEGYEKQGKKAVNHGPVRDLLGPRVPTSIGSELVELGIDGFINEWSKRSFPTSQIERLNDYTWRLWNHITSTIQQTRPKALLLNITHDLVLMSFRRGLLGIEASESNWTPFLGGFGIVQSADSWLWYEKGVAQVVGMPNRGF